MMFRWLSKFVPEKRNVSVKSATHAARIRQQLDLLQSNGIELQLPELLQYKYKVSLLTPAGNFRAHSQLTGLTPSSYPGRGIEYKEVRQYQHGDDIRSIDWRITARTGKTHTRIYQEDREQSVLILTDLSATLQFGSELLFKSVQAAHLAALLNWQAISTGHKTGGVIFNQTESDILIPGAGESSVLRYCQALIDLQKSPPANNTRRLTGMVDALQTLVKLAPKGSRIILISDFSQLCPESQQALQVLSQRCYLRAFRVTDTAEFDLPDGLFSQEMEVTDGFDSGRVLIGNDHFSRRYRHNKAPVHQKINDLFFDLKVPLVQISAGQSLEAQAS